MVSIEGIPAAPSAVPSVSPVMFRPRSAQGFTLVELMLAALLGTFLCGVLFQLLFAETRQGGSLAESLQLKQWQRRTLELLKCDLEHASSWQLDPDVQPNGPVLWLIGNRSSRLPPETARVLLCTALDQRHRQSGAAMC